MVKLFCAIVSVEGSAFSVDIDASHSVSRLKKAIKAENANALEDIDAGRLQLFLAKGTDGAWLTEADVKQGLEDTSGLTKLEYGGAPLSAVGLTEEAVRIRVTNEEYVAGMNPVHVLVVVDSIQIRIKEIGNDAKYKNELTLYQQRGELIQCNCKDYCQQILSKIDALYALSDEFALPFICVEGSSGMGKSQLAFALGGSRPWFYWPILIDQRVYENFSSISDAFGQVTIKDDPMQKSEEEILNSESDLYRTESLWTFGFIYALLKHCSKEPNQQGKMIRFEEETSLYVEKCNREKVVAFCKKDEGGEEGFAFLCVG